MVKREVLFRIFPFALFMGFIGLEEALQFLVAKGFIEISSQFFYLIYPVKAFSVGLLLIFFRKEYPEIRFRELKDLRKIIISIVVGIIVFLLWVKMDWSFGIQGTPNGFNPLLFTDNLVRWSMIAVRLLGAVLVVPVMEELFWRSFLVRYVIQNSFTSVPIGQFTWASFLVTVVLFGLEHHFFLAGIMAGIAYNLLLYYSKSLLHCIVAHAITNLVLGIYILHTGKWYFW